MTTVARKEALDAARQALRSGSLTELRSAIEGLPPDGKKSSKLRRELAAKVETIEQGPEPQFRGSPDATFVSDGIGYEFHVREISGTAFFDVRRTPNKIVISINSVHPFAETLLERDREERSLALSLLAAWAHYELDQSDHHRLQTVQDSRADWSRVVRRLLGSDSAFAVSDAR